jgi:hypothetical protein
MDIFKDKRLRPYVNLPENKITAIEREMKKEGYGKFTRREVLVYYYMGKNIFFQLLDCVFRYTCFEAEYLGVDKTKDKDMFRQMNLINLERMCDSVILQLPILTQVNHDGINFNDASDEDMRIQIKRFYKDSRPKSIEDILKAKQTG